MQRVRGGEGVVDRVPVAEVVLHVETGDAQRGRVGDGAPELLGVGTGGERVEERVDDALGVVGEELPGEPGDVGEPAVPGGAGGDRGVEAGLRARDQLGEVVRVSPRPALLRPAGRGGAAHERGQHVGARRPAHVAERLERLVGEVDGVAAVDEDVVGDRGEHHALDVAERHRTRRAQSSARARRRRRSGSRRTAGTTRASRAGSISAIVVEWAHREARRMVASVAGDEREAVHERERAVVGHRATGARWPWRRAR